MNSCLFAGCLVKIWRKDFFPLSRHFFSRVPVNVTDISLGQDFKRNLHLVTNSVSCTPSVNKAQLKRHLIASKGHRKRCFHICAVAYNTYIWSVLCIHWMSIKGLKRRRKWSYLWTSPKWGYPHFQIVLDIFQRFAVWNQSEVLRPILSS